MCSYEMIGVVTNELERDAALRLHPGAKAMPIPRLDVSYTILSDDDAAEVEDELLLLTPAGTVS